MIWKVGLEPQVHPDIIFVLLPPSNCSAAVANCQKIFHYCAVEIVIRKCDYDGLGAGFGAFVAKVVESLSLDIDAEAYTDT